MHVKIIARLDDKLTFVAYKCTFVNKSSDSHAMIHAIIHALRRLTDSNPLCSTAVPVYNTFRLRERDSWTCSRERTVHTAADKRIASVDVLGR